MAHRRNTERRAFAGNGGADNQCDAVVFQEAPRYFLKVVQRGRLSREVERTFSTNSRLPDSVAMLPKLEYLDIHANQISGPLPAKWDTYPRKNVL